MSRRAPVRPLAAAALVACVLLLATAIPKAAVRPPRLQYEIGTLSNGLTVVLEEDHSVPIVHLQLTYHVGSKNE
jgi:zinc protease